MGKVRWQVVDEDGELIVKEIHKAVVHQFSIGDVDDPELYASQHLHEWKMSEQGQFVMKYAVDTPKWDMQSDQFYYGYECVIVAELEMKKLSEFYLKWGSLEK